MDLMTIFSDFLSTYGPTILSAIFTAIGSFIGYVALRLKNKYEKHVNDETKKSVVESTVKYVEQIYKDLNGKKKLEKAKENIVLLLNEKGISITELEMDILIEAACNSFKKTIKDAEE